VQVYRLPLGDRGGKLGAARILATLFAYGVRAGRADVVQGFHFNATTIAAALLALLWRRGLVIKVTHRYSLEQPGGRRQAAEVQTLIRLARAIVVPSSSLEPVALRHGVPRHKLHHISNGVDTEYFSPPDASTRAAWRKELGYASDDFIFLWIGRLHPVKGLDRIVPIWDQVLSARPNARLLIVGDGSHESVAQELAARHRDSIQWLHFRKDPRPCYGAADAMLLTTHAEGLANTLLEALATGLPAVVSDAPENLEVGGGGSFLIPFGDSSEHDLATAIIEAIDSRSRWNELSAAARARAVEQYGLQATAAKWAALYRSLL